jgi:RecB family endonuclease NucS
MLLGKRDTKELGIHWIQTFLEQYPTFKSRFITGLDKEYALAQHPQIIQNWFDLFERIRKEKSIYINDCYNIDKKGIILGMIGRTCYIIPKEQKKQYITQPGNQE